MHGKSKAFAILAGLTGLWCVTVLHGQEHRPEVYLFGVVPQFGARQLADSWVPILDELEKRSGHKFKLAGSARIPDFEQEFQAGRFDFAYMNPYHVLQAAQSQGYVPLVRDRIPVRGILVVRRDSAIRTVQDLAGQTIAFPSPNAMGASLMVRADLARKFGLQFEARFVQSHSSVYLSVAKALTTGGGGVKKSFDAQPEAVQSQLRILYTTQAVPAHPIVAHRRIPSAVRERVRAALLAMDRTAEGRVLLAAVPIDGLVPAASKDYKSVTELGLDRFTVRE